MECVTSQLGSFAKQQQLAMMAISRPISEDVAAAVAGVRSVDEEDFEEVLWQQQQQQH